MEILRWDEGILPLCVKFPLFVRSHERWREAVGPQAQAALRTPTHVMHQRNRLLIQLILIKKLVLNRVHRDKIPHIGTCIPAHIIRIHIDFAQELDHFVLVGDVGLCAGGSGCDVGGVVLAAAVRGGDIDGGEGERVCDLEGAVYVHADEGAGCGGGEGLRGVLDDFHHDLGDWWLVSGFFRQRGWGRIYQSLDLDRAERRVFE